MTETTRQEAVTNASSAVGDETTKPDVVMDEMSTVGEIQTTITEFETSHPVSGIFI